jgi:hypothetical protein
MSNDLPLAIGVVAGGLVVAFSVAIGTRALRAYRELCRVELFRGAGVESLGPSNPTGWIAVDGAKLRQLDPALADDPQSIAGLAGTISTSDGQPAVVVNVSPLLVCTYNDELDTTVWLGFPDACAAGLQVGQKLACAATYVGATGSVKRTALAPDLAPGPGDSGHFDNVTPIVVDFVSSDAEAIRRILSGVPETSWRRLQEAARGLQPGARVAARDGRPSRAHIPAAGRMGWCIRMAIRQFV